MVIVDEISEDVEEPDEVKQAWDELVIIQREQQRYTDIKLDLHQDLEDYKKRQKYLEDVSSYLLHLMIMNGIFVIIMKKM